MLLSLITSTQVQSFISSCFICAADVVTSSMAVQKTGFYVTMLVTIPQILPHSAQTYRSTFKDCVHCLGLFTLPYFFLYLNRDWLSFISLV